MARGRFLQYMTQYLTIIMGTGLLAFSVKCIYDPCGIVVGGFSGAAVIVKEVSRRWIEGGIPLGLTTFCLNVPVFFAAYPMRGRKFVGKTFLATLMLSVWLSVLPALSIERDLVLAALFGGLSGGLGIGMVLRVGATTGGTDMLGALLQGMFPAFTISQLMAVMDGIIILAGAYLFGLESALYALVAVFVTTKVSDAVVVGMNDTRSVHIITDRPEDIAREIFQKLERGVTGIYSKGMYTGSERTLLFCVVTKKEIVELKSCIYGIDPAAFVIIGEAKEVHGEGFL